MPTDDASLMIDGDPGAESGVPLEQRWQGR